MADAGLTTSQEALAQSMLKTSSAAGGASLAMGGFTTALKGLKAVAVAHPVLAIAAALATAATIAVRVKKHFDEMAQAQRDAAIQTAKDAQEEQTKIEGLYQAYLDANAAYKEDADRKGELISATDDLLQSLGEEGRQIRDLKQDYTELGDEIDGVIASKRIEQIENMKAAVRAQRETVYTKYGQNGENVSARYGIDYFADDEVSVRLAELLANALEGVTIEKVTAEPNGGVQYDYGERYISLKEGTIEELYAQLNAAKEAIVKATREKLFSVDELNESSIYQFIKDQIAELEPEIEKLNKLIEQTNADAITTVYAEFKKTHVDPTTLEAYKTYRENLIKSAEASTYFVGTTEDIEKAVDSFLETISKFDDFQGFKRFKHEFKSMGNELQKAIQNMLKNGDKLTDDQARKLKAWAEQFGYSTKDVMGYIAKLRDEMAAGANADNITNKSVADLATLRDELAKTSEAWEEYQKMLEGGDMGDAAKQYQSAWKKAIEDIDAGRIGSKAVRAAGKLFFSDDMLAEWGYDPNKIAEALRNPVMEALFGGGGDDDTDIGIKFANYIREHANELGDAIEVIALEDGRAQFAYKSFSRLAEAMGISDAALGALLDSLDAYNVQCIRDTAETRKLAAQYQEIYTKYGDIKDATERTTAAVQDFIKAMATEGMDEFEIIDVLKTLGNGGLIAGDTKRWGNTVKGVFDEIAKASNKAADELQETTDAAEETPKVEPEDKVSKTLEELEARLNKLQEEPYTIKIKVTDENGEDLGDVVIDSLNVEEITSEYQKIYNNMSDVEDGSVRAKNAVSKFIETLAKDHKLSEAEILGVLAELSNAGTIALDVETLNGVAQETIASLKEAGELAPEPKITLDNQASEPLENVQSLMLALDGKTAHLYVVTHERTVQEGRYGGTTVSESSGGSHHSGKFAKGTKDAPEGDALVNEKAPELISDGGVAYIANGGKPGFVHLSKGAVVFNADETKRIFRNKYPDIPIRAYADGTGNSVDKASLRERLMNGKRVHGLMTGGVYKTMTCSKCGYSWRYSPIDYPSGFTGACGNCGQQYQNGKTVVQKIAQHVTQKISDTIKSVKKTCPYCGDEVHASTNVCPYCSYNFSTGRIGTYTSGASTQKTSGGLVDRGGGKGARQVIKSYSDLPNTGGGTSDDSYVGSGGGSSAGGANYASEAEPQKVDWIQVLLNRIQKGVAALEKVATSGFKSLSTRMKAATEEVKGVNKEIEAQQRAAERYMSEAEGVGLSDDLAALVKAGTIDISEYDDETRELIDKYSEWYEKALDASYAVEELRQEVADLYKTMFDDMQTDFDNQLSQIEHRANMINASMAETKARGYLDSAEYYSQLSDIETEKISKLNEELDGLREKFRDAMDSGTIEANSEAWYAMAGSINEVEEAIAAAHTQLIEYQKTMRSIEWSYFDYAQERFGQLQQEANFLIDLMSNDKLFQDNGWFDDKGTATMGLRVMNYNAYMAQADAYAKELRKVNEELANDQNDTELIARRETLLGLQRQMIQAAEGEKDAIRDLVSQGIQLELSAVKELIDAYEESLDSAKSLYDYQKKVTEKTSDIAKLNKQIAAYQNDSSEENRARLQKLQEDLRKAQEDLQETEWEQNIAEQKKLLSEFYNQYEETLNARLDDLEALVQEMVSGVNQNADDIQATILDAAEQAGYTITEGFADVMGDGVFAYYDKMFDGVTAVNDYLDQINRRVDEMAAYSAQIAASAQHSDEYPTGASAQATQHSEEAISFASGQISGTGSIGSGSGSASGGSGSTMSAWVGDEQVSHAQPGNKQIHLGGHTIDASYDTGGVTLNANGVKQRISWTYFAENGKYGKDGLKILLNAFFGRAFGEQWTDTDDDRRNLLMGYSGGGLADYTGLAMLHGTKTRPELVLNADDTKRFLAAAEMMRTPVLSAILDKSIRTPEFDYRSAAGGDMYIELGGIQIDHVQDYNDFVTQLRDDPKFEKLIGAMTFGPMNGESAFGGKNRIRW